MKILKAKKLRNDTANEIIFLFLHGNKSIKTRKGKGIIK